MTTELEIVGENLDLRHLSATICAELAAGLSDARGVCEKYDISEPQWEKLKKSPVFRKMLKEALQEWAGDLNAGKRITKKAEIMLEDSLHRLYQLANDPEKPGQITLDSIEKMAKLAGRNERSQDGNSRSQIAGAQINIHIDTGGEQRETITVKTQALPPPIEDEYEDAA
jgi:hypothetical protein